MTRTQGLKRSKLRTGSTAVEYAVVLGLITIACIGTVRVLGQNAQQAFQRIATVLDQGSPNPPPGNGEQGGPGGRDGLVERSNGSPNGLIDGR